jgi:bifunctional non-homologous end joining protein LigD
MAVPKPMLATLTDAPRTDPAWVYELKYDGIRAIVEVGSAKDDAAVHLWSRNGNDKSRQFPSVVRALQAAAPRFGGAVVLDGELVALDADGRPAGFQRLQGRIHLTTDAEVARQDRVQPVALIVFDLLRAGADDLTRLPLTARRARLEALVARAFPRDGGTLRLSEQVAGDSRDLEERAKAGGWEGLIAKEAASPYQPGRRSPAWRKIKLVQEQEFVVGGWTEPRQTRSYFGALLLGVYDGKDLVYVGHTGTGFDEKELSRVSRLLREREIEKSPFSTSFKTNEPAHWVRPDLVAQIRFTEWTADAKLRHPVYLGLRDDKAARDVVRESAAARGAAAAHEGPPHKTAAAPSVGRPFTGRRSARGKVSPAPALDLDPILAQLRALEDARRDGTIVLPNGDRVGVTNLAKVFWPDLKITKGDLLRYYVEVSPYLLPAIADRPLVMKRFPNGVAGQAFYQHRTRAERPPAGVRMERLAPGLDPDAGSEPSRFVGGSLTTLLYMTQLASISQDPWFSRIQSPHDADYVAIDLDPTEAATFTRVLDVTRWVRDELASLGVPSVPKTSGSRGLHIYIPLPPHTSYESGMIFCQIVATIVASHHPKAATVERAVARRPRGSVYVDFLQNIMGKTLASAYSARASSYAGVSTPLAWREVEEAIDPREFTIRTAPARFRSMGDLWAPLRESRPANLEAVFEKYRRQPQITSERQPQIKAEGQPQIKAEGQHTRDKEVKRQRE